MQLQRPKAFAGFLIVGLIALVGFAAFSATSFISAPPIDLPDQVSGKTAGAILGVDLGPDTPTESPTISDEPSSGSTNPDQTPPADSTQDGEEQSSNEP